MGDTAYVVTGYVGAKALREGNRTVIYAGNSPTRAFECQTRFTLEAGIEVEIWENGIMVKKIKQQLQKFA